MLNSLMSWVNPRLRSAWPDFWPEREGEELIREVETRLQAAIQEWELQISGQNLEGWVSVVLYGRLPDGREVVLKAAPTHPEMRGEVSFARQAPRAVKPLAVRDEGMTLLLPRVRPGTSLLSRESSEQARVCGRLNLEISHVPAGEGLLRFSHSVLERMDAIFYRAASRVDDPNALALGREAILRLAGRPWSLSHGDLHAGNVLLSQAGEGEEWVLIDAKGTFGPRAFDAQQMIDSEQLLEGDQSILFAWAEAAELERPEAWDGVAARAAWQVACLAREHPVSRQYTRELLSLLRMAARAREEDS